MKFGLFGIDFCLHYNKLFVYILADWQSGGSCMVVPTVKPEDVAGLFPKGKLSRQKQKIQIVSINFTKKNDIFFNIFQVLLFMMFLQANTI